MANLQGETQAIVSRAPDSTSQSVGKKLPYEGAAAEFFDDAHQIDLEAFSANTVYDKLNDQTLSMKKQLAQTQAEIRDLYDRVHDKTGELRGIIEDRMEAVAPGAVAATTLSRSEIVQRQRLARRYDDILFEWTRALDLEAAKRDRFRAVFISSVKAVLRQAELMQQEAKRIADVSSLGITDEALLKEALHTMQTRAETSMTKLQSLASSAHAKAREEATRCRAWYSLGKASGAALITSHGGIVPRHEIFSRRGEPLEGTQFCSVGPAGLANLKDGVRLVRPPRNRPTSQPVTMSFSRNLDGDLVVHPETGRAVYLAGSVAVDRVRSKPTFITDTNDTTSLGKLITMCPPPSGLYC